MTYQASAGSVAAAAPAQAVAAATLPSVLLIGPTPPPHHGVAVFIAMLRESPHLARRFRVLHLDTADRRGLGNMGKLEAGNVAMALRHAAMLAGSLARRRPDVVYLCIAQNTWGIARDAVLLALARLFRRRIAIHLHGSDLRSYYDGAPRPMRWLLRRCLAWADAVGVLGNGLRPIFDGLVPAARVHVAAPAIDDAFPDGAPFRSGSGDVVVAFIGMLFRPKGILQLIEAAAAVPGARFVMAGEWYSAEDRQEAEALVASLGVKDRVTFPGRVGPQEKRQLLAEADIFAFPGYQPEGLPLVVLEAMAAGLPLVATPVGTIADVVRDGVEGVLVPPRDVAALAAALNRLAADAATRAELGAAARRRFEEAFTQEQAVNSLANMLEAAVQAEARR
jgi:glycosyltransferase involved in cell wall biosynthesis